MLDNKLTSTMTEQMYQISLFTKGPVHEMNITAPYTRNRLLAEGYILEHGIYYILTAKGVDLAVLLGLL